MGGLALRPGRREAIDHVGVVLRRADVASPVLQLVGLHHRAARHRVPATLDPGPPAAVLELLGARRPALALLAARAAVVGALPVLVLLVVLHVPASVIA